MTREELVHELADEAARLVKTGKYTYKGAIGHVCRNVLSLKKEVGSVLGKRGVRAKMIKKIIKEEQAKNKQEKMF